MLDFTAHERRRAAEVSASSQTETAGTGGVRTDAEHSTEEGPALPPNKRSPRPSPAPAVLTGHASEVSSSPKPNQGQKDGAVPASDPSATPLTPQETGAEDHSPEPASKKRGRGRPFGSKDKDERVPKGTHAGKTEAELSQLGRDRAKRRKLDAELAELAEQGTEREEEDTSTALLNSPFDPGNDADAEGDNDADDDVDNDIPPAGNISRTQQTPSSETPNPPPPSDESDALAAFAAVFASLLERTKSRSPPRSPPPLEPPSPPLKLMATPGGRERILKGRRGAGLTRGRVSDGGGGEGLVREGAVGEVHAVEGVVEEKKGGEDKRVLEELFRRA